MSGEKPVFASDWDDVWYEFIENYFPYYNKLHGTNFQPQDLLHYDLSQLFMRDIKYILETVDDFHLNGESVEHGLIDTAQEVAPVLAERFDIVIITARKSKFKYRIEDMLDFYVPGSVKEVYLQDDIEKAGSKGKLARALGAVALADDHIANVLSAEAENVRGLLRNRLTNYYHPLTVERVNDWYDIYEKLTGEVFKQTSLPLKNAGRQASFAWRVNGETPIR